MKYILLLLLTFTVINNSQGQNSAEFFKTIPLLNNNTPEWARLMYSENPNVGDVEKLYQQYYKENDFVKNIHTQNHKHWMLQIEGLINQNGFIQQLTKQEEDALFQLQKEKYQQKNAKRNSRQDLGWEAIGPFETFSTTNVQPISWHKNIYAIDQSLSNPDILICGTEAGGIYKSTDKAANWTLISLGEVFSGGNSSVKIHPTDATNFLISSNSRIYQSLDGGTTWIERYFTDGTGNEFEYSPSNNDIVFHTSSSGLFKSVNGGTTWSQVYSESCWDINFHPANNQIVYLLKSNPGAKKSELFRSDDNGTSWNLKDNGWYIPFDFENAIDGGGKIGVSPASEDLVYVCLIGQSKEGDQGWIGIYKSPNKGDIWTNPSGQDGSPYGPINGNEDWNVAAYDGGYHQGYYNFDMEVSPTNPDKLWIASIRLTESSDGGQTYQSIGAANSTRLDYIHADVQDIEVRGNDIWVATDGGIDFSDDELTSHVAVNRGIQAAHFWGFNTGWNEDTFTGGKYHDGTSGWFENYGEGKTYNIGGVEEASGYVHPIESRKLLYRTHYASTNTSVKTIPEIFGDDLINHPSFPVRPNESYSTAERSGVYFDPRYANHIYVGLENNIYKSTNGGINFDVIYTFPDETGIVYEIEISRSNPDVMYCVYNKLGGYWDPSEIWKTVDGGITWNKTFSDPSGNKRRFRISIHPEDENNIWICTPRGVDGDKVHNSIDGGTTWFNKTTPNLDGESLTDILYQGGSDDVVYVTSQYGVLYWDSSLNDWIDYSSYLPLVTKSLQINPFYRDGELRLASNGRGVWGREMKDILFTPIAQPITYDDIIKCPLNPIQFDCYSMLKHEGATWEWSITPEPLSISSSTERNPIVVFGSEGNYTVSLTVTDAQGNSSNKTIENMVTVVDDCPHCQSYGDMSYATAVTLVDFNEINNATGKTQAYTDYSDDFSTTIDAGSSHDLTVNVNTDGNYTIYAKAWIDWNQDLDFDDANEEYDLGSAANTPDGPTNLSPLTVLVPQDALDGNTIMRISAKYNGSPTACETGFDGEVEDYEIVVNNILGIISNTLETNPIIYPNPTNGAFSIDLGAIYNSINLSISDINGKIIQTKKYSEGQLINLNLNVATGVYIIDIASEGKKAVMRLLKN
jgi:photosystem II stability/assembly factor-like uncharacterized protein